MKDQNADSLRVSSTPARPRSLVRFALPVAVVMVVIIGLVLTLKTITPPVQTASHPGSAASTQPVLPTSTQPVLPTSVKLEAHFGTTTTTASQVTVPVGTKVTLTVIPDQALEPFQNLTMGIYAQDPYAFSELVYCTYPNTVTCTYVPAYDSAEKTDYTKGTHTFVAFLGRISGNIDQNSNTITITWT